jgi:leucyl/phenylalanyl-tRNA---protein transferase
MKKPQRPLPWLDAGEDFPPVCRAWGPSDPAPGLLAAGAALDVPTLVQAYSQGIFPWFSEGQPPLWWSPDPRMVLPTADFKLSHSLKKTLRRFLRSPGCEVRFDHNFRAVISACASTPREGQDGTWIVPEMVEAYCTWHALGSVHSAETWVDGRLVGGLYFVNLGRMCFGESMFSHRTDASKIALAALVAACRARQIAFIDCQQNTGHLASMGAHEVPRADFLARVAEGLAAGPSPDWTYDDLAWSHLGL